MNNGMINSSNIILGFTTINNGLYYLRTKRHRICWATRISSATWILQRGVSTFDAMEFWVRAWALANGSFVNDCILKVLSYIEGASYGL